MPPHGLAGAQPVDGHDLIVATLFLRVDEIAVDGKGRPARANPAAPQLGRRRGRPVADDLHAGDGSVACGSAEPGPLGRLSHGHRCLRDGGRLGRDVFGCGSGRGHGLGERRGSRGRRGRVVLRLREQPLFRRRRPPPPQLEHGGAANAVRPEKRDRGASARMATAIEARRARGDRWRVPAAQATSSRLIGSIERMYCRPPCAPPATDGWMKGRIAATATAIRTSAPTRSSHGARLKNSHQRMMANTPTAVAIRLYSAATGSAAVIRRPRTTTAAAAMPGQSRNGRCMANGNTGCTRYWFPAGGGSVLPAPEQRGESWQEGERPRGEVDGVVPARGVEREPHPRDGVERGA